MNKKLFFLLLICILTAFLIGCSTKTEETKAVPYPSEKQEEIPNIPNAGESWEAVKIQVVEIKGGKSSGGKSTDYTINIGGDYVPIENTNMKLKIMEFIPDFYMSGQNKYASRSKELNNPAVLINVIEEGKPEPFKGWIFSRYPDIHKGPSDKYSFRLVDFVKKQN